MIAMSWYRVSAISTNEAMPCNNEELVGMYQDGDSHTLDVILEHNKGRVYKYTLGGLG